MHKFQIGDIVREHIGLTSMAVTAITGHPGAAKIECTWPRIGQPGKTHVKVFRDAELAFISAP